MFTGRLPKSIDKQDDRFMAGGCMFLINLSIRSDFKCCLLILVKLREQLHIVSKQ